MANLHGVGGLGVPPRGARESEPRGRRERREPREDEVAQGVPRTSPLVRSVVVVVISVLIAAFLAWGFWYVMMQRGS